MRALFTSRARLLSRWPLEFPSSSHFLGRALPAFAAPETVKMEGLRGEGKSTTQFSDFERTSSGLQFKDFKMEIRLLRHHDQAIKCWLIGQASPSDIRAASSKQGISPKEVHFADDGFSVDYLTFNVGDMRTVIPGIDEAVRSMKPGGIRRLIVPEEVSTHHQQYIELLPCGLSHFVAKRDH